MRRWLIAYLAVCMALLSCDYVHKELTSEEQEGSPYDQEDTMTCAPEVPTPLDKPDMSSTTVVSWRDDLTITVDDIPVFPFGVYSPFLDEAVFAEMEEAGMNAAIIYNRGYDDQTAYLEMGREHNVMIAMHPFGNPSEIYTRPPEELEAELADRAQYGSFFFWYTFDEPDLWNIDPVLVNDLHEFLHEHEPNHPTGLVMAPLDEFGDYVEFCDFFMVDPYPVPYFPLEFVTLVVEKAKEFTKEEKPLIGVGQAFDWFEEDDSREEGEQHRPTTQEIRNMTYQMLAADVQAIIFFSASRIIRNHPDIWQGLLGIASEVDKLKPVLIDGEEVELDDVPELVRARLLKYEDWLFLIVVNLGWSSVELDVRLPEGLSIAPCAVEFFEGYRLRIEDNRLLDTVPAIEARVYQMFVE